VAWLELVIWMLVGLNPRRGASSHSSSLAPARGARPFGSRLSITAQVGTIVKEGTGPVFFGFAAFPELTDIVVFTSVGGLACSSELAFEAMLIFVV